MTFVARRLPPPDPRPMRVNQNLDLTAVTIAHIRSTWGLAFAAIDSVPALVHERLILDHPEIARSEAFADVPQCAEVLPQHLGGIVRHLDDPEVLMPFLAVLGANNARRGVTSSHYLALADAVMTALDEALGERFGPPAREAWRSSLDRLRAILVAGAAQDGVTSAVEERAALEMHTGGVP